MTSSTEVTARIRTFESTVMVTKTGKFSRKVVCQGNLKIT